jgi:hypothetical protein
VAVGVPADNPDDRALEEGREPTQLKATRSR